MTLMVSYIGSSREKGYIEMLENEWMETQTDDDGASDDFDALRGVM